MNPGYNERRSKFLDSIAMRCPPMDRIRAKATLEKLLTVLPCSCESCTKLHSYLRWTIEQATEDQLKSWFVLTLGQAAQLLRGVEQWHSDYLLEYASRLCRELGIVLLSIEVPIDNTDILHELEQDQAAVRNRIEWARLKLCFNREFTLRGVVCQSHIDRAVEQISLGSFANDSGAIEFDANLHKKVAWCVNEMILAARKTS